MDLNAPNVRPPSAPFHWGGGRLLSNTLPQPKEGLLICMLFCITLTCCPKASLLHAGAVPSPLILALLHALPAGAPPIAQASPSLLTTGLSRCLLLGFLSPPPTRSKLSLLWHDWSLLWGLSPASSHSVDTQGASQSVGKVPSSKHSEGENGDLPKRRRSPPHTGGRGLHAEETAGTSQGADPPRGFLSIGLDISCAKEHGWKTGLEL